MPVSTTPRLGLTSWSSDQDQVDRGQFAATLAALDLTGPDHYDLAANIGSYVPLAGAWFYALDTQKHYVGSGATWNPVLSAVDTDCTSGTLPTASSVNKGQWFWTTDTLELYRSNGASMIPFVTAANAPAPTPPPVGTIVTTMPGASVATGWLACNGSLEPTSAYPALFAKIGYQYGGSGASFALPTVGGFVGLGRPGPVTETFEFTGSLQTWTVPAGFSGTVAIAAIGGAGGGVTDSSGDWTYGGLGAQVTGTLSVTSGQTFTIYVGGQGQNGWADFAHPLGSAYVAQGGWGFGSGGSNAVETETEAAYANAFISGAGGGGTALLLSGSPIVVAGAGGGTAACGERSTTAVGQPAGGNGGTPNGAAGGGSGSGGATGGTGASVSGPGTGGTRNGGTFAFVNGSNGSGPATGSGATGGTGNYYPSGNDTSSAGGGGGYYGGGAGGCVSDDLPAAGGGGSSYISGLLNTAYANVSAPGNGLLQITYTPPTPFLAYIRAE